MSLETGIATMTYLPLEAQTILELMLVMTSKSLGACKESGKNEHNIETFSEGPHFILRRKTLERLSRIMKTKLFGGGRLLEKEKGNCMGGAPPPCQG